MAEHDLHLISFEVCPYVERSRIVLEEKGIDYDLTFIDLRDKPDWFLDISPRGKVPVLEVDDKPFFESYVINEMLEELYPRPKMFPDEPIARATARAWIVFNNDAIMGPAYQLMIEKNVDESRQSLRDALEKVDEKIDSNNGKYFLADRFGLVDAVYAPIFNRWEAIDKLGHGDLMDGLDTLKTYATAVVQRDSVKAARYDNLTEDILSHAS